MIRAAFHLALVVLLVAAARSFLPEETSLVGSGASLAFGFVLLAAVQAGTLFAGIGLPRLTGYLTCGFVAGPSVYGLVTERMLIDLRLVNGVAIGLIALSAGGELNVRRMRSRLAAIAITGGTAMLVSALAITATSFALGGLLPFMRDMTVPQRGVVALVMGIVFTSLSPTVALAIISETGAAGPICEFILGLVVLGDITIVIAFAAVNALANSVFGASAGTFAGAVAALVVSMVAGVLLGLGLSVYLKKVQRGVALFVVGVCFLVAEAGARLHLEPLLVCLTAGFVLENLTDVPGAQLVSETQAASLPVFAVFFAVAGAGLHWHLFKEVAPFAFVLAVVRAAALIGGSRVGMALGGVPPGDRAFVPPGLLPQSGISIGLCIVVGKAFAGWGEGASALLLGGVMVNEMIGPVLLRNALLRSGEAGRREVGQAAH